MKTISPTELKAKLSDSNADEILLDVRETYEHKASYIPNSENIPLAEVEEAIGKLKNVGTVYVHCGSGGRSARACNILASHGVNVVNVDGGIDAWKAAGFEVLGSGRNTIPIMRQVMIVAGALTLIGATLGFLVSSWWYALSAFVGAGLFFAGVTGICTMTYLLGYMPWNRA